MTCMSKKRPSGKHATPRKTIQLPQDWLRVAQQMASARPMPVMWLLVELIRREAEAKGVKDLPPPPWQPPEGAA